MGVQNGEGLYDCQIVNIDFERIQENGRGCNREDWV